MVEPVGITLAALSLLDPAIRSVRKAYGIYKLNKCFGEHYAGVQRRLEGEQARLEVALETNLVSIPDTQTVEQIGAHLSLMSTNFQSCQDLIAAIDGHTVPSDSTQTQFTPPQNTLNANEAKGPAATRRQIFQRLGFRTGRTKQARNYPSPETSGPSTSCDYISRTSDSTHGSPATLPQALQDVQVQERSKLRESVATSLQDNATIATRWKWSRKRSAFMHNLEEIHASNNFIKDIVSMRALTSIHKLLIVPPWDGTIPEDVLIVQNSLQRLHRALTSLNKRTTDYKPISISVRILKASDYVQMKKKLALGHDYITFRKDTAIYPLQLQSADPSLSTMILAETVFNTPQSFCPRIALDTDVSLPQMLKDQAPEADESFQEIGFLVTPDHLADIHNLFQDISVSWVIQDSLENFIKNNSRCRTYYRLAVQIAISYMYFVSLASSHNYPRLENYQYYDPAASERKALGPDSILMPYLSIGFGSKPFKRSTIEFGGSTSHSLSEDEAMTNLGLLLHQIGCWTVIERQDRFSTRDVVISKRDDLIKAAGVPYAQVVDLCLVSKEGNWEPQAQAERIYKKVIGPLQLLVDELRWD